MKGAALAGAAGLSGLFLGLNLPEKIPPITWTAIEGRPFFLVTPGGPKDGGNYGPSTPGTTTMGIQEAINAAPEQGTVVICEGVQTSPTANITISKNINLIGLYSGGHNSAYGNPQGNEVALGNLTIAATSERLYSVAIIGVYVMGVLTISANPYDTNRLLFQNCYFQGGVVHESAASVNSDSTVYENCWITNTTPYGKAAPSNGIATYTVTSSGDNNVNQTFFNNCAIEAPYAASGDIFHFLVNGANFYPVLTGCQLHIPQTMTSGIGTIFKLRGSRVILVASVHGQYTEFHSPMQIVEALVTDCTDPQIDIDWNCFISGGGSTLNNLVNITSPSSQYGFVKIRGYSISMSPALPGTWPTGSTGQVVVDMHFPHPSNMGWNATTPPLPAGTNAANLTVNGTTQRMRVYQEGGAGQKIEDSQGNAGTLPSTPPVFELGPLESVYYTIAVPTSWRWYGVE